MKHDDEKQQQVAVGRWRPRNAGAKWLRSLLEQKGGVQAALLSYIRKPIDDSLETLFQ